MSRNSSQRTANLCFVTKKITSAASFEFTVVLREELSGMIIMESTLTLSEIISNAVKRDGGFNK